MSGTRQLLLKLVLEGSFAKIVEGCAVRTNPLARGTLRVS
jgi:hypothetical protein